MHRCHAALTEQSQGRPEPFLQLWSHAADVTIMAAIGGSQVGFDAVSELVTAASKTQRSMAGAPKTWPRS